MQSEQQQRIMGYFIEEAKDHLNTIEQGLLNLQSTIGDPEMISEVFRAAHSVKGGAAMLGLNSIQQTSHRLEDYFKVLKECPTKVDQKLESLFLRVFDTLQELLEQLQGPFGLTDDKADEVMAEVEPVFNSLNEHLQLLVRQSGGIPPEDVELAPVVSIPVAAVASKKPAARAVAQEESALQLIFKSDVPTRLREMLQLFKQPDTPDTRQQLQDICRTLAQSGEQFDLPNWCELLNTAERAIALLDNTYRVLAPIVIKDIKQAQERILTGQASAITTSESLLNLTPALPDLELMDDSFTNLLAEIDFEDDGSIPEFIEFDLELDAHSEIAVEPLVVNAELPDEVDDSDWFNVSTVIQADTDLEFDTAAAPHTSTDPAPNLGFGREFDGMAALTHNIDHNGPEVGVEELNSLADLFEGEMPDLGMTWQQEEVISDAPGGFARGASELDTSSDFSDFLLDQDNLDELDLENDQDDDLSALLNNSERDSHAGQPSGRSSSPASGGAVPFSLPPNPWDADFDITHDSAAASMAANAGVSIPSSRRPERVDSGLDNLSDLFADLDEDMLASATTSDTTLGILDSSFDLNASLDSSFEGDRFFNSDVSGNDAAIAADDNLFGLTDVEETELRESSLEVLENFAEDDALIDALLQDGLEADPIDDSITAPVDAAASGQTDPWAALDLDTDVGQLDQPLAIAPPVRDEQDVTADLWNEGLSGFNPFVSIGQDSEDAIALPPDSNLQRKPSELSDSFLDPFSAFDLEPDASESDAFFNLNPDGAGFDFSDEVSADDISVDVSLGSIDVNPILEDSRIDSLWADLPSDSIEDADDISGSLSDDFLFDISPSPSNVHPTEVEVAPEEVTTSNLVADSELDLAALLDNSTELASIDLNDTSDISNFVDDEVYLASLFEEEPAESPPISAIDNAMVGSLEAFESDFNLDAIDTTEPLHLIDNLFDDDDSLDLYSDDESAQTADAIESTDFSQPVDELFQVDANSGSFDDASILAIESEEFNFDLDADERFTTPSDAAITLQELTVATPEVEAEAELSLDEMMFGFEDEAPPTLPDDAATFEALSFEALPTDADAELSLDEMMFGFEDEAPSTLADDADAFPALTFEAPPTDADAELSLNEMMFGFEDEAPSTLADDADAFPALTFEAPQSHADAELSLDEMMFGFETESITNVSANFDTSLDSIDFGDSIDFNDFSPNLDTAFADSDAGSVRHPLLPDLTIPETESVETSLVDDFADLDRLLPEDAETLNEPSVETLAQTEPEDFMDLDALLDGAFDPPASLTSTPVFSDHPAFSDSDDFADLDALLSDDTAPPISGIPVEEDDFGELDLLLEEQSPPLVVPSPGLVSKPPEGRSDFDDLEKLLEDADQTLGGSPSNRGARGPSLAASRGKTRPTRGVLSDQTMRVSVKNLDNLNNLVGELVVNRNTLEQAEERLRQFLDNLLYQVQQLSDVGQRMRDLYERSLLESSLLSSRKSYQLSSPSNTGFSNPQSSHATGVSFDALEMDRFTGFHTLSQEMIELIVRVRESASDIDFVVDETDQVTRNFRQITTQLQEGLTRSRMVPFAQTADRLPRAVRDISLKCGKQAELTVEGRETLIDKMILEQLYDPMTHLVNNAITHGIELPEERAAAGKLPLGQITVRTFHQGNQTVISVMDDGAGINPETVKRKAIEKGLITSADAEQMSRLDVYDLLFHHGFSTKDKADDYSGRGVGMDVVRTSLNEIRGVINIDSIVGKGTTFTIRLPLTLSISKALCCISNRARIAFPMDGVEDMLDIPKERIQRDSQDRSCIQWRDQLLPFQPLSDLLRYNRSLGRGSVYGGNQEDDIISVVVLRSNAGNFLALQVDQVLGEQEIVIKQLEGPVPKPVGVAGATVLGDGRIMPIADVLELIDLSMGRIRREAGSALWEKDDDQGPSEPVDIKTEPTVLIVDDSITVRELLSMTFSKIGYRVEQARDGQEAWEKLRSGLPCDLVFCDIEMPRMDGLELLSRIQKDPSLTHLPIAMLTSRGADRHRQMAIQLGAKGYFTKPYLEEALLDAAQRMLKGEVLVAGS